MSATGKWIWTEPGWYQYFFGDIDWLDGDVLKSRYDEVKGLLNGS